MNNSEKLNLKPKLPEVVETMSGHEKETSYEAAATGEMGERVGFSEGDKLAELREKLADFETGAGTGQSEKSAHSTTESATYKVTVSGREYRVEEVPKDVLFPELGLANIYSPDGPMSVREDLPESVKRGVIAHEAGHLRYQTRSELVAIAYGFIKEPVNSLRTVMYILGNKEQRQGLIKEKFRGGWF